MATKAHPGKFDCYRNARPNEPLFILLGRDRFAGPLVRACVVLHDVAGLGERAHRHGGVVLAQRRPAPEKPEKVHEAIRCANAMEACCEGRPYCHVCLCTEEDACEIGFDACSWANKEKTICTNPACMAAAGLHTPKKRK